MISQMGLLLPEGPVEPGATWGRKLAIPAGPDGQTRGTEQVFTYRGPEPTAGRLEAIDLTIKYDPLKPDPAVPMTIKAQESRGHFAFDNEAGRIENSTVTEKVELSGTIMGKEIAQEGETSTVHDARQGRTRSERDGVEDRGAPLKKSAGPRMLNPFEHPRQRSPGLDRDSRKSHNPRSDASLHGDG